MRAPEAHFAREAFVLVRKRKSRKRDVPVILWRNAKGHFAKRGNYLAINGKLIKSRGKDVSRTPNEVAAFIRDYAKQVRDSRGRFTSAKAEGPKFIVENGKLIPVRRAPEAGIEIGRKRVAHFTYFRAMGTMESLEDLRTQRPEKSPPILNQNLEEFGLEFGAPAAFYSNQSLILGQVKFEGIVPLAKLIDRLNEKLQFVGQESPDFDFRDVYTHWHYRYEVIEFRGEVGRFTAEEVLDSQEDGQ